MSTRQSQPSSRFEKIGADAALVDITEFRDGQSAGLVENDRIDFRQAFDGVTLIEKHPSAEKRAGRNHLDRRNRQRQSAGARDDQHGRGDQQGLLKSRPRDQPSDRRDQCGEMDDRRIEARGPVGQHHAP